MSDLKVKETLETLLKIQKIDGTLAELQVSKLFFPKLLEELNDEISSLDNELVNLKAKITQGKKDISSKELELVETRDKLKNSQNRLLAVHSNKEYDAVQREIKSCEERIAQIEEELIRLLNDQEDDEKKAVQLEAEFVVKKKTNLDKIAAIEREYNSIEGTAAKIKAEREALSASIDKRILNTYERIVAGMNGYAVVQVKSRACGGCYQALPPRQIQEIRRQEKFCFCEACGRILVWDDEISG